MKTICIDSVTIIPGRSSAGGGIWTYARNVLLELDRLLENENEVKIIVFVNSSFDVALKNIEVVPVNANTEKLLSRLKYVHFTLPALCKKYHADVLHKLATEVPFYYRGKLVLTIHDLIFDFYIKKHYLNNSINDRLKIFYFKYIEKNGVRKSSAVFTNSESLKLELINLYGNKNVVVTGVGSPSGHDALVMRERHAPLRLYCIAGYYPHKGHAEVIKLFETLVTKYNKDITLYLRGNPSNKEYFDSIMDMIRQSGCRNKIIIEDYVRQHSVEDIYAKADIIILLSEYEGFGLPVIEAQVMGLPVICSDIPIFREVSGGYACFYKKEDADKSASAVNDFLKDNELRKLNVEKGFMHAKKYQWGKVASQILEAYKSV